jgi:hypothetical protein
MAAIANANPTFNSARPLGMMLMKYLGKRRGQALVVGV